jgi:hypothetical protein
VHGERSVGRARAKSGAVEAFDSRRVAWQQGAARSFVTLVRRIRSSHDQCSESECELPIP